MGFFNTYKKSRVWQLELDACAPKKGDWAPDFELAELDGESHHRLSGYRDRKPVALIFGSYT